MSSFQLPVKLHIYDISYGWARTLSPLVLGMQIKGIWHTGIVVYDKEYSFGAAGIESCTPGETTFGVPVKIKDLGTTTISDIFFNKTILKLKQHQFRPNKYNFFEHNCNTFTNVAAEFLTGKPIPKQIQDLPQKVLKTEYGPRIKQIIELMLDRSLSAGSLEILIKSIVDVSK